MLTTSALIELNLHGMNMFQARIALDAALRSSNGVYRIRAIHGFHMGCALRDMIRTEYASHPLVKRIITQEPGTTVLVLREL
ncbi:MAG: Smr/MutS family protein [Clostridia bacterium]